MRTGIFNNIRIGKPQTTIAKPSHVPGVHQGNKKGNVKRERGLQPQNGFMTGTAARSTGINPERRDPIDPSMPNLSPS